MDLEAVITLKRYEGSVILVTHDEDLIDAVAIRIWIVTDEGNEDFQGTSEAFKANLGIAQRGKPADQGKKSCPGLPEARK